MRRTVAIVTARMGSTRFPGKSMAKLDGKPVVQHVLERVRHSAVDEVILATSTDSRDLPLVNLADSLGIRCHRGSESDVLARMYEAAKWAEAEVVVRVTGDCPRIDSDIINRVLYALDDSVDFASNILTRTYAKGLDTEAMHMDTLARMDRLARSPAAREHVTWFAYRECPELFRLRSIEDGDHSTENLCVDTPRDLARLQCAA